MTPPDRSVLEPVAQGAGAGSVVAIGGHRHDSGKEGLGHG